MAARLLRWRSLPANIWQAPGRARMSQVAASSSSSSLGGAIHRVLERVELARAKSKDSQPVHVVAVSKTKPVEALKEVYAAGQRVFGENYVQEILEKAPAMPGDVQWHFIGHLQSNKVKILLDSVPNLAMVETVDSAKLADKLNRAWAAALAAEGLQQQQEGGSSSSSAVPRAARLPVLVQVNTSGEDTKAGVEPSEAVPLALHIHKSCPSLRLAGLMTIGMPDYSSRPEDFSCLADCRRAVSEALGVPASELELSMGMSGDFEQAVEMGSTNVRVGSIIFGARK